jgi:two-component system chemotaxis response regulator CheB
VTTQPARDIVVIGASLGGLQAVPQLLERVPLDFRGSVFVVLHRGAHRTEFLTGLLGRSSGHVVVEPVDRELIVPGLVYLAPGDVHMTIEDSCIRVLRGPKEHFTRPAIDPLFRSAAAAYGPRVVGIVLTGGGHDGLSGLIAIKTAGGLSLVQSPAEARAPSMPMRAILDDHPDAVMTLDRIGDTISSLMNGKQLAG